MSPLTLQKIATSPLTSKQWFLGDDTQGYIRGRHLPGLSHGARIDWSRQQRGQKSANSKEQEHRVKSHQSIGTVCAPHNRNGHGNSQYESDLPNGLIDRRSNPKPVL